MVVGYILDSIQESWYIGQIVVRFQDAAFKAFMRHATELVTTLRSNADFHFFLYSPNHTLTYVSVQVSLIAFFAILTVSKDRTILILEESSGMVHSQSRDTVRRANAESGKL